MKSKKLVVFLIVLVFLAVLVVLNSTLFTLQSVSINWLTTKYQLNNVKDYTITDKVNRGSSIFLIKKEQIANELEKDYPYLRVVSIETKFPNKIVIHSSERESLFAIKLSDDKYVIVDELGKVLDSNKKYSDIYSGSDLGAKPIKVFMDNVFSLNPEQFVVGENIKNENIRTILTRLAYSLRESNYVPTASKGVFTEINMNVTNSNGAIQITLLTRNGITLVLKDAMEYTTDKFLLALERYGYYHQEGIDSGKVEVRYNNATNLVVATYINKD